MKGIQLLTFITALTAAAGGLVVNAAETVRQIATATFPSVVLLVVEDERGQPVALGSGFFVKENVIASNFHVVENAARAYAKLVGQKTKYDVTGVVGLDSKHDLVLLGVEEAKVPPLKLGDGSKCGGRRYCLCCRQSAGVGGNFLPGHSKRHSSVRRGHPPANHSADLAWQQWWSGAGLGRQGDWGCGRHLQEWPEPEFCDSGKAHLRFGAKSGNTKAPAHSNHRGGEIAPG